MCQTSTWIRLCTRARHPHGSNYVHVPDIHMDQTMYMFQTSTWIRLCTRSRHPHGSDYVHVPDIHMEQTMYVPDIHMEQIMYMCQTSTWIRLYVSDRMTSGFFRHPYEFEYLNMSGIHTDQKRLGESDIHMDHTDNKSDLRLDMSDWCLDVSQTQMHESVWHLGVSDIHIDQTDLWMYHRYSFVRAEQTSRNNNLL